MKKVLIVLFVLVALAAAVSACEQMGGAPQGSSISESTASSTPESPVSSMPESPASSTPESPASSTPESPASSVPESTSSSVPESSAPAAQSGVKAVWKQIDESNMMAGKDYLRVTQEEDLAPFTDLQADIAAGEVTALVLFSAPNDHWDQTFAMDAAQTGKLLDLLCAIEAKPYPAEEPPDNPSLGGGCDVLLTLADGRTALLSSNTETFVLYLSDDSRCYGYDCANAAATLAEIGTLSWRISYQIPEGSEQ